MADKRRREISDKVPKDMLKSKEDLPVRQPKPQGRPPKAEKPKKPKNPKKAEKSKKTEKTKKTPQRLDKPINPEAQRAVSKAMNTKQRSAPKKRRYRGGNYILYYILAAIVVVVVMIVLSNTVLFRCNDIEVRGNIRYTAAEIIGRSGLKTGDNLLHADTLKAEWRIVNALAYIDKAEVKKSFPTKFIVTVSEAEKWYCVSQDGVLAVISRRGKIIEQGSAEGLAVVRGYDAESVEPGSWLKSTDSGKSDIPAEVFTAAEKAGLENVDEIDLSDKFSVKVRVDGRIILELGPAENVEGKLLVAKALIDTQIGKDESVTILLTNPEKVPVQNNSSSLVSSSTAHSTRPKPDKPTDEPPEETDEPSEDTRDTYEPPEDTGNPYEPEEPSEDTYEPEEPPEDTYEPEEPTEETYEPPEEPSGEAPNAD